MPIPATIPDTTISCRRDVCRTNWPFRLCNPSTGCPNRLFAVVCRMKGSVGEPHSDQRDRTLSREWRPDGFVRGHHLWTAVKSRGGDPQLQTECFLRCDDDASATRRVVRRFVLPHRIEHVGQFSGERRDGDGRSSSLGDAFRPLDHRILGPPKIQRPCGLSQRPSHLWRTSPCQSFSLDAKARRVFARNEAEV